MGKEQHKDSASKTYVLKVSMHCQCNGCIKKINDGLKEVSLSEGVDRADLVVEKEEVIVVGTLDPDKICCLLHEETKKHMKIETQRTMSERSTASYQRTKNRVGQAPPNSFAPGTPESPNRWPNSLSNSAITPSAPPLPETWMSQAVPSERCAYRWSAPSGTLGMWTTSDITGTLAVYEVYEL